MSQEPSDGAARGDPAGVQRVDRLAVVVDAGLHRADERDVVGDPGQAGQQLGQLHAALAVLGELPGLPKSLALASAALSYLMSPGKVLPSRRASSGLGSNRSIWLGPPCMNSEIIALARRGGAAALGLRS